MQRVGRNDPCPCGSGKKFKKCCEAKMGPKTFSMRHIEEVKEEQKSGLSQFFQSHIFQKPKEEPSKEGESKSETSSSSGEGASKDENS